MREDVFIANVLKCRPPENRNPTPLEIEHCGEYLLRQLELIQPIVVVTLGNFATKLLRDDPTGITRIHGQAEERVIGRRAVRLFPVLHPAAALYTPANRAVLEADFARIPGLLALGAPEQPAARADVGVDADTEPGHAVQVEPDEPATAAPQTPAPATDPEPDQLGLF